MHKILGEISLPGDKSISHRLLMLSLVFPKANYEIRNISSSFDVKSTMEAVKSYGVLIKEESDCIKVNRKDIVEPKDVIDVGNSGTTIRLFLGIASGFRDFFSVFTGDESIRKRPMKRVVFPLREMGAIIYGRNNGENAPLSVWGSELKDFVYSSQVASAQVKSALIFASLIAKKRLTYTEPYVSRDHTERMIEFLGVDIKREKNKIFVDGKSIEGKSVNGEFVVPGDVSSAAFFIVAGAILDGSELVVRNVLLNPTRSAYLEVLRDCGVRIEVFNLREECGEPVGDVRVFGSRFSGFVIDEDLVPRVIDELPILAVFGMFADGVSEVRGAKELRYKESDRIRAIVSNINAIGGKAIEFEDGFRIEGNGGKEIIGGDVKGFKDHRIIMSFYIAGLKAQKGVNIDDISWIRISYPEFIKTIEEVVV